MKVSEFASFVLLFENSLAVLREYTDKDLSKVSEKLAEFDEIRKAFILSLSPEQVELLSSNEVLDEARTLFAESFGAAFIGMVDSMLDAMEEVGEKGFSNE